MRCRRSSSILVGVTLWLFVLGLAASAAPQTSASPMNFPPQWNELMGKANAAADRGDMTSAIGEWSKLYRYAPDACMRELLTVYIRAAKDVRREEWSGKVTKATAIDRWERLEAKYWSPNPCSRP